METKYYITVAIDDGDRRYMLVDFPMPPFEGMGIIDPIPGIESEWKVHCIRTNLKNAVVIVDLDLDYSNHSYDEDKLWDAIEEHCQEWTDPSHKLYDPQLEAE